MRCLAAFCLMITQVLASGQPLESVPGPELHFDFGNGPTQKGYTQVGSDHVFTPQQGFGFIQSGTVIARSHDGGQGVCADGLTSERPFYSTMGVPEGNYRISRPLWPGCVSWAPRLS
jgi:hypothetical protein